MSYAEHGPRIFRTGRTDSNSVLRYGEYIIPRKRSEGRLKVFGSCTDLRAWSLNSLENSRYFREVMEKPLPQGKIVPYNVMIETLKLLDTQTQAELDSLREQLQRYRSLQLSPEQRRQLQNFDQNEIEDGSMSLREIKSAANDEIAVPERPGTPQLSICSSSSNYESESVHRSRIDDESLSESRFEELDQIESSKTDSNEYVDLTEENQADTHAIIIEKESGIIALKNALGAKDVEVEQLKDLARNLEAKLRKKETTLDNFRDRLNDSQQQIIALGDQLKQRMEESRKRLHTSKCSMDHLSASLAEKTHECIALNQEIEVLRSRIEEDKIIREERDCLVRALDEMCSERNALKKRNCEQAMNLADQSDEINRLLGLLNSQAAKYSEREKQMERMLNDLRAEITCPHRDSWSVLNDAASLSEMENLEIRKLRCALLEDLQRVENEMKKRRVVTQHDRRGTCSKATWKCGKELTGCTNEPLKTMQAPAWRTNDEEEDDEIYKRIVSQTCGSLQKIQQLIVELTPYREERLTLLENINCLAERLDEAQNRKDEFRDVKEKGERDANEKGLLAEAELLDERIDEVLVIHVKRSIERVERIALCLQGAGDYISQEMSRKDKEVEERNEEIAKLKVQVASRVSRGQGDHAAHEEHTSELSRVRSDLSTTRRSLQRTRDQLQSSDFRLIGANQKIKDLGLEIDRLTKENKCLNNTVLITNDLAIKVDEMELRLDMLQEENSSLKERVSRANELCAEYQGKLMDLKDQGMKAKEAFERAEFRLQSVLLGRDNTIDKLREEKETTRRELVETKLNVVALTEQMKTLKKQNKNLDFLEAQISVILKLEKKAKMLRATKNSVKSQLVEERREIDKIEADLNAILDENEKMERDAKRLREYVERKSKDSLGPLAVARQEADASSNQVLDRPEIPKTRRNSSESVDLAYQSEINELKEKLLNDGSVIEKLQRHIDSWNNKAVEQEKTIFSLQAANADLKKRIDEIQRIREAERDEGFLSGSAARELIGKIERLESEIREKDERIEKLMMEIKATKEEFKNLGGKVQLLTNEKNELSNEMRIAKVSWRNKMTELQQQYNQRVRALHDQHNVSVKKLQAQHEEYVENDGNSFDPATWLQSLTIKETTELHKRIGKSLPCDASKITRALNDKQNQQLQEDEKLMHSDIINLKTGHLKESAIGNPGYIYERRKFSKTLEAPVKDDATFDKQQTNFIYQCAIAHSNDSGN